MYIQLPENFRAVQTVFLHELKAPLEGEQERGAQWSHLKHTLPIRGSGEPLSSVLG